MQEIDKKIKQALEVDEEVLKSFVDEPSFLEMFIQCYRGKNRWLNFLVILDIFIFLGLAIWALIRFFDAETTQSMLGWSMLFYTSLMVVMMGKIWAWMQINKNSVVRETKRVELQLVRVIDMIEDLKKSSLCENKNGQ